MIFESDYQGHTFWSMKSQALKSQLDDVSCPLDIFILEAGNEEESVNASHAGMCAPDIFCMRNSSGQRT